MGQPSVNGKPITRRLRRALACAVAPPWAPAAVADLDRRLRSYAWLWYLWVAAVAAFTLLLCLHGWAAVPLQAQMSATGFDTEIRHAMDRMMNAMDVATTGDADRDFVATMTPHHQGAIDMAIAELRHGKDETLRRMAQEIIVEQQQEIVAMRLAADRLPAGAKAAARLPSDLCTGSSSGPRYSMSRSGGEPK